MLIRPPLEKLLPKVENRYTLAILVAKRARQLVDGAMPLMRSESPNYVTVACEELGSNRISCVKGIVNAHIPLRPEIEAARLAARNAASQASLADAVRDEIERAAAFMPDSLDDSDAGLIAESLLNLSDDNLDDSNGTDEALDDGMNGSQETDTDTGEDT